MNEVKLTSLSLRERVGVRVPRTSTAPSPALRATSPARGEVIDCNQEMS